MKPNSDVTSPGADADLTHKPSPPESQPDAKLGGGRDPLRTTDEYAAPARALLEAAEARIPKAAGPQASHEPLAPRTDPEVTLVGAKGLAAVSLVGPRGAAPLTLDQADRGGAPDAERPGVSEVVPSLPPAAKQDVETAPAVPGATTSTNTQGEPRATRSPTVPNPAARASALAQPQVAPKVAVGTQSAKPAPQAAAPALAASKVDAPTAPSAAKPAPQAAAPALAASKLAAPTLTVTQEPTSPPPPPPRGAGGGAGPESERSKTRWLLLVAACAGLGVGAGAAFAVSKRPPSPVASVLAKAPAASEAAKPGPGTGAQALPVLPETAPVAPEEPLPEVDQVVDLDPTGEEAPPVLPEEDTPPSHDPAAIQRLVIALKNAHAAVHASAEASASDKATEAAIDAVFAKDKTARRFAREFYASFGPGRFVKGGALTPLGRKTIALVLDLERHALAPSRYDRAGLQALLSLSEAEGGEVDGLRGLLQGILAAPTFDETEARERLEALRELPEPTVITAVASTLHGSAANPADAKLDATVMSAFLELTLDFRFIKRAGPTTLRTREPVFERERRKLKDFIAEVMSKPRGDGINLLLPPHPQYQTMLGFYETYRGYEAAGGCEKLPANWRFRPGSKGEEVKKLQARLKCQGFYEGELDGRFEGETVEAVKLFQRHHDLPDEGAVLEDTMKALNVSIEHRVKQIALVLQRMREARFDRMGEFFIRVNIPSFLLKVFERGEMVREHRVIVGTNRLDDDKVNHVQGHINRTKLLGTRLYEVIVNPTWILPKRVEEGELASSLEKDENYLAKSNIKKVKLGSGTEVFVQGAGDGNVLGKVKFLLEESNAIYLHDTDKRHLFRKQRRDFSHGCMRVQDAIDFGKWLLAHDGWPTDEVERAFGARSSQRGFKLRKPVHTVVEYMTVDVSSEGRPVFFADIYGYDSAFFNNKLPPVEKARWGSERLRPRWVPLVDAATVNEWKAKGKPAPRNLGPDGKPKPPKGKRGDAGSGVEGP